MKTALGAHRIRKLLTGLAPSFFIAGAFLFFMMRDRSVPTNQGPEEALIEMAVALGDGNVKGFLSCFGGDLGRSLTAIAAMRGEIEISQWLKERGQQMKGFAIIDTKELGPTRVSAKTETVYQDRSSAQTFLLELNSGRWEIIDSDFEAIREWANDFGRPIWEPN